jgi:flagellar export protein FliJ
MPFRFPLASVLKVREDLEHRELLMLERKYSELAAAQSAYWQAQQALTDERKRQQQELMEGTTAVQLQTGIEYSTYLEQQRRILELKLLEAQSRLREQQEIYWKARQERDVLQELRKQQFQKYSQEEAKREQSERDELFLIRRRWAR